MDTMAGERRMEPKFECIVDPCGLHAVWDNERGIPVIRGEEILAFETAEQAEAAATILNRAASGFAKFHDGVFRAVRDGDPRC